MRRKVCNIQYNEGAAWLVSLSVTKDGIAEEMIDKKNAEEIVEKYKNDDYIVANIENNTLNVSARYPIVVVDCKYPGEKSTPSIYTLTKQPIKDE